MLSGKRILQEIKRGNIEIAPFDEKMLGPNSYNLHLADELIVYDCAYQFYETNIFNGGVFMANSYQPLDMKKDNPHHVIKIPKQGLLLQPGRLYLGRTVERTRTDGFVPCIDGRSSVGRLGICTHATAGFGDNGFRGYWTFEIFCVQPVRIYAGVEIGQIYFDKLDEADEDGYGHEVSPIVYGGGVDRNGKYQNNKGVQTSKIFKEFKEGA